MRRVFGGEKDGLNEPFLDDVVVDGVSRCKLPIDADGRAGRIAAVVVVESGVVWGLKSCGIVFGNVGFLEKEDVVLVED